MKPISFIITAIVVIMAFQPALAFESQPRPILYPNDHYHIMGKETAQADIDDCWAVARETGASEDNQDQLSLDAANDAAAFAVFGAATAAAIGGNLHDAAVAGAVAGGSASIAAGMVAKKIPRRYSGGSSSDAFLKKGTRWPAGNSLLLIRRACGEDHSSNRSATHSSFFIT
jgi:hypothetical protein